MIIGDDNGSGGGSGSAPQEGEFRWRQAPNGDWILQIYQNGNWAYADTFPARGGGSDNGPAWASLAERQAEFEYQKEQDRLTAERNARIDALTAEIEKGRLEEQKLSRLQEAALAGGNRALQQRLADQQNALETQRIRMEADRNRASAEATKAAAAADLVRAKNEYAKTYAEFSANPRDAFALEAFTHQTGDRTAGAGAAAANIQAGGTGGGTSITEAMNRAPEGSDVRNQYRGFLAEAVDKATKPAREALNAQEAAVNAISVPGGGESIPDWHPNLPQGLTEDQYNTILDAYIRDPIAAERYFNLTEEQRRGMAGMAEGGGLTMPEPVFLVGANTGRKRAVIGPGEKVEVHPGGLAQQIRNALIEKGLGADNEGPVHEDPAEWALKNVGSENPPMGDVMVGFPYDLTPPTPTHPALGLSERMGLAARRYRPPAFKMPEQHITPELLSNLRADYKLRTGENPPMIGPSARTGAPGASIPGGEKGVPLTPNPGEPGRELYLELINPESRWWENVRRFYPGMFGFAKGTEHVREMEMEHYNRTGDDSGMHPRMKAQVKKGKITGLAGAMQEHMMGLAGGTDDSVRTGPPLSPAQLGTLLYRALFQMPSAMTDYDTELAYLSKQLGIEDRIAQAEAIQGFPKVAKPYAMLTF